MNCRHAGDNPYTTHNQMQRLLLICEKDAFVNAYVLTSLVTDVLHEVKDGSLRDVLGGNGE